MASLQPKLRKQFTYMLVEGEYYSRCQAKILKYLNWEGIILPQHSFRRGKSFLFADINGLYSLKERLLNEKEPLPFLLQFIKHCSYLWDNVELTQLWGNNLFFDPEHIYFPHLNASVEDAQFLYLPIYQGPCSEKISLPFGIMHESGILGFVELLLEQCKLSLEVQEALVHAATTQGMKGILSWSEDQGLRFLGLNNSPQSASIERPFSDFDQLSDESQVTWTKLCHEPKKEKPHSEKIHRFEPILSPLIQEDEQKTRVKKRRLHKIIRVLPILQILHLSMLGYIYANFGKNGIQPLLLFIFALLYISNDAQIFLLLRKDKTAKTRTERRFEQENTPSQAEVLYKSSKNQPDPIEDTDQLAFLSTSIPGSKDEKSEERAYILKKEYILGTDPRRVDYLLPGKIKMEPTAKIQYTDHHYYLIAYSQDKVTLNGRKLKPFERYELPKNSTLRFNKKAYYFYAGV